MQDGKRPGSPPGPLVENDNGAKSLHVENFHYNPNSLTELRKIAETNPELASKIVDSQTKVARWYNISEWVGFGVAGVIALAVIVGFVAIVVQLGWWQSIAFLLIILAISHVLRTVLTGEWSDTSWLGQILKGMGAPPNDDERN